MYISKERNKDFVLATHTNIKVILFNTDIVQISVESVNSSINKIFKNKISKY